MNMGALLALIGMVFILIIYVFAVFQFTKDANK